VNEIGLFYAFNNDDDGDDNDVELRMTMVSPAYLGARSRWLTVQQAVVIPEKPMAAMIRITARSTLQLT